MIVMGRFLLSSSVCEFQSVCEVRWKPDERTSHTDWNSHTDKILTNDDAITFLVRRSLAIAQLQNLRVGLVLVCLALTALIPSTTSAAEPTTLSPRADSLDLLFTNSDMPVRLELRVAIDGQSVPAIWDETFAKLFSFLDRDGNGTLDKIEASRLPSPFTLRQVLWGLFVPFGGDAPPFADLDRNADGNVSGDELADFYRRAGLGGVLVGIGRSKATDQLTNALVKHLDTNQDGNVIEAELITAAKSLLQLDANDDELIGPGELVAKTAYPGTLGSILLRAPAPNAPHESDPITDALPFIVLPLRTADTHWMTAAMSKQPALKADVLTTIRTATPKATWQVRFGTKLQNEPTLIAIGDKPPTNARLTFSTSKVRLELRTDDGKLTEQTVAARKRYTALFAEFDTNSDGTLDDKELGTPRAGPLQQLANIADRDNDTTLTQKEFTAWLNLQEQLAKGHVLLTVLDHGHGLFELLDADHDGSLSTRELRAAWDRLKSAECVTDGRFDQTKLPRHLFATVSRGHPLTTIGKPVRLGPDWFQAMDRNGDGDVSRREFTGSANLFDKLDADHDGLIDGVEASQAQIKK